MDHDGPKLSRASGLFETYRTVAPLHDLLTFAPAIGYSSRSKARSIAERGDRP